MTQYEYKNEDLNYCRFKALEVLRLCHFVHTVDLTLLVFQKLSSFSVVSVAAESVVYLTFVVLLVLDVIQTYNIWPGVTFFLSALLFRIFWSRQYVSMLERINILFAKLNCIRFRQWTK